MKRQPKSSNIIEFKKYHRPDPVLNTPDIESGDWSAEKEQTLEVLLCALRDELEVLEDHEAFSLPPAGVIDLAAYRSRNRPSLLESMILS